MMTTTYRRGSRLPIPLSDGRPLPLPRGPGPLGPTTRHLPTATTASTRGRTGHIDAVLYLLYADGRPSLEGPPCPTTDGNNGDNAWRGQDTSTPPAHAASCPSPPHSCAHNQRPRRRRCMARTDMSMLHARAASCPSRLRVPCPSRAHHAPQLTARTATTCGEDRHFNATCTCRIVPLAAVRAMPLAATHTMPSWPCAPCPLRLCAPCPIDGGGGVSSPLRAELFASSTNASDFAVVASSAPTCKFDTGGALGQSWYGACATSHPVVDRRARRSGGSLCAMQRRSLCAVQQRLAEDPLACTMVYPARDTGFSHYPGQDAGY
jgi:hypothetical protein